VIIPYEDLPGFPALARDSDKGVVCCGQLEGVNLICLKGRISYADSGNRLSMLAPIEALAMLGVNALVVTGGIASVDADSYPGTLVAITDHIDLGGLNPLVGAGGGGGRISLANAYDSKLNARLKRAAALSGVSLREAQFLWLSGPSFETAGEAQAARRLGAEVIGTAIPSEVILARRAVLRACAAAVITHFGTGFQGSEPSLVQTREMTRQGAITLRRMLRAFMKTRDSGLAISATPGLRRPQP